jgi:WD40 repeat protein
MQNIFYTLILAFFIPSFFVFGMDSEKNIIDKKISLNPIASIPFPSGKGVAYLSGNQLLAFKKTECGIHIFNLSNRDSELFDTYIDIELARPFCAERDKWGNNVYLGSNICYQTDNKTAFFYNQQTKEIIKSQPCKAVYAGMSDEELNCYMMQDDQGKVQICNLINGEEKNHELLTTFFMRKPKANLKCFSLPTDCIIYAGGKNFFDQNIYFSDIKNPDSAKNIGECCHKYYLSNDGKFILTYGDNAIYWQELVEPYNCGSMQENIYSKVLGIAILPYKDLVLSVTDKHIHFWDVKRNAPICYAEANNNPLILSSVYSSNRVSVAPEGHAFAVLGGENSIVYEMPFVIRSWQWRESFALLHCLLMKFFLNKDVRKLLAQILMR